MNESFIKRHKCAVGIVLVLMVGTIIGTVLGILLTRSSSSQDDKSKAQRTFKINHKNNTFEMDEKPFKYIAGSIHYFRALPQSWRQKIKTLKAAGLNAVDIYVQWSLHNPQDGIYNWDEIADIEKFIETVTEEELYIILRPGPYICAEIDNGGLPYWLANKYPEIKVRTSDENFLFEVEKWYSILFPRLEKHFYVNGGNIIMVQIENEYGAFKVCDHKYKEFLRDLTLKYTKENAVLFTVDGIRAQEIECGKIKDVFVTIDFGLSSKVEIDNNFKLLRQFQPTGPLVNTEFYTGWPSHWQGINEKRNAVELAKTFDYMLEIGANIGVYMFYGGTNFGFWSGADSDGINNYVSDITSYDYDAPMDEAGNPTEKYMIFRDIVKKHTKVEHPVPEKQEAAALNPLTLQPINSILSEIGRKFLGSRPTVSKSLLTFEEMRQFSGFILYETNLPKLTRDPSYLVITDLRDRALIYIDDELTGVLSRENDINRIPISLGSKLSILVENQGRINYFVADDYKGIIGDVKIQNFAFSEDSYHTFNDWTISGFPFDNSADLETLLRNSKPNEFKIDSSGVAIDGPIVFYGTFSIEQNDEILDTYWDTSDWDKGFVFINGFNLGRYWSVGPQMTIYIPKDVLKHGKNEIYIVELQKAPLDAKMNFRNAPVFVNSRIV